MQVMFLSEHWYGLSKMKFFPQVSALKWKNYLLPLPQGKISKSLVSPAKEGFEDLPLHIIDRQPPISLLIDQHHQTAASFLVPRKRARSSSANGLSIIRKVLETTPPPYIIKPLRYVSGQFSFIKRTSCPWGFSLVGCPHLIPAVSLEKLCIKLNTIHSPPSWLRQTPEMFSV